MSIISINVETHFIILKIKKISQKIKKNKELFYIIIMNQYLFQDIKTEDDFSLYQEESFEENYEEMINSYLKERHIYSASLPLQITTDTIIDQIQIE